MLKYHLVFKADKKKKSDII